MLWSDSDQLASARTALARDGLVQIRNYLDPDEAERLRTELAQNNQWDLALTGPQGPVSIEAQELRSQSASEQGRMMEMVRRQSRQGFSFLYLRRNVVPGDSPIARTWGSLIGSEKFIQGMRELTGDTSLVRADAHACLYRPGHFLRTHDDLYPGKKRRFAYVMNLTRDWSADWGGLLHFVDDQGRPDAVLAPHFNSLNLFRVPRQHFVSQVASYARRSRLSITGWLFAGDG